MTTKAELMGVGMPGPQANKIGQDVAVTGLTATGTNQATAYVLTSSFSNFTTVAASTGALLPSAHAKGNYFIMNNGANTLAVYPAVGETINSGSANASVSIPAGKGATFIGNNNQWGANISA